MSTALPAHPSPHPKPWEQKNPWIAGVLAYLIPGAGHVYQGRTVKGLIYFCSILGLFFWGQKLGEGMLVHNVPERGGLLKKVSLSYAAQLGAGAVALPALLQNRRAEGPGNSTVTRLTGPFSAQFQGRLNPNDDPAKGWLNGTLRLEPIEGQFGPEVRGTLEGTLDGQPTKLKIGGSRFELDRPIKAGFRRRFDCGVIDDDATPNTPPRWISGTVPRPFVDAYGAPPDPEQIQEIYGRIGKLYELALVFTWIAGLLNVLAIWDCVLGPAYGFGDEQMFTKEAGSQPAATTPGSKPEASPATETEESSRPENRPAQKSQVG